MRLWRICKESHAASALSGRGGLVAGGRWHPRGRRIVYTSGTLSLAVLEILVHTDQDLLPTDLVYMGVEVPDDIALEKLDLPELPMGWQRTPAPLSLQRVGAGWIDRRSSAVLRVPSAVVPHEHNYLLNPEHPEAGRVRIVEVERFVFDPRPSR